MGKIIEVCFEEVGRGHGKELIWVTSGTGGGLL
jgi:hypothetical protein